MQRIFNLYAIYKQIDFWYSNFAHHIQESKFLQTTTLTRHWASSLTWSGWRVGEGWWRVYMIQKDRFWDLNLPTQGSAPFTDFFHFVKIFNHFFLLISDKIPKLIQSRLSKMGHLVQSTENPCHISLCLLSNLVEV